MTHQKRVQRAAAKARAGRARQAKPAEQQAAQPLLEVPVELSPADYGFTRVPLPTSRPIISAAQLLRALDEDDEPTAPLAGVVVDEQLRPAQHEGLAPVVGPQIPVPSNPFLNAHAPKHAAPAPSLALPARLTDVELRILGRPVPADAPALPVEAAAPQLYQPLQRDRRNPLVFSSFDASFWAQVNATSARLMAPANALRALTDRGAARLDAQLRRTEAAHQLLLSRVAADVYRGELADAITPMPRRTAGAALAAIEADRREWVAQ